MLTQRSEEKELLDVDPYHFSQAVYNDCLKKLFRVNRLFGFFHSTVRTLKKIPDCVSLIDIGCGGGLFLLHLTKYFPKTHMLGMDICQNAISEAESTLNDWQQKHPHLPVKFCLQSQTLALKKNSVDVILATMVCHHMSDAELIVFLRESYQAALKAVIINDLHRHQLAQWLYALVSPILFRNKLITHDGLISIRRGFTRNEWKILLQEANITHYRIKWYLPFRWQIILYK